MSFTLWCLIENDVSPSPFPVTVSPSILIAELKEVIRATAINHFKGVDAHNLNLWKLTRVVPIKPANTLGARVRRLFSGPEFQQSAIELEPSDKVEDIFGQTSNLDQLHIFVIPPAGTGSPIVSFPSDVMRLLGVAEKLQKAMWGQDLNNILRDVDQCKGFKYVPADVVDSFQLVELGCCAKVILVREEYLSTMIALERLHNNPGGIVVTGHPGIGKSIFIFFALLYLLSKKQRVALQCDRMIFIFHEDCVDLCSLDVDGRVFGSGKKIWALSDSTEGTKWPCSAFQKGSKMGTAWIVQATSPAKERWDRWSKECNAGLFVMDCITPQESRALSIVHGFDVERFQEYFTKWGPSARICLNLAWGTLTEPRLRNEANKAAKKFAKNPDSLTMEAYSETDSHLLFTTFRSGPERDVYSSRVATQYLYGLITEEIARMDAANQVSFYTQASTHPYFRSTFGYVFEKYFYVWLSSKTNHELLCTAAEPGYTAHERAESIRLRPVGWEKVIIHHGDAGEKGYKAANQYQTPFCWIPASRSEATFDAVICNEKEIITIQVTVARKHSVKPGGFNNLKKYLPSKFQANRHWRHVFITSHPDTAAKLRAKKFIVAQENKISIYTAVLNISLLQFTHEDLDFAITPSFDSFVLDSIEMEAEIEGEQEIILD